MRFWAQTFAVVARLGGEVWVEIGVPIDEETETPTFGGAMTAGLRNTSADVCTDLPEDVDLEVRGWRREDRGLVLQARRADHLDAGRDFPFTEGGAGIDIVQREQDEGAWPFVRRVAHAAGVGLVDDHDDRDLDLDRLEEACPVGSCLAMQSGAPADVRFAEAVHVLAHQAHVALLGTVRTLAESRYRLVGVCEAGMMDLGAGDTWKSSGWPTVAREMKSNAQILRDLFTGERRHGAIPLQPGPVRVGRYPMFSRQVTTRVRLDDGEARTTLVLADVAMESVDRSRRCGRSPTLLGVYSADQPDDPHLVGISPAGDKDSAAGGPLAPLAQWRLLGEESQMLCALQSAPGFVEDETAFYAEWQAGDHVLFDIDDAGVAMVRGAPRRRLADGETARVGVYSGAESKVEILAETVDFVSRSPRRSTS